MFRKITLDRIENATQIASTHCIDCGNSVSGVFYARRDAFSALKREKVCLACDTEEKLEIYVSDETYKRIETSENGIENFFGIPMPNSA